MRKLVLAAISAMVVMLSGCAVNGDLKARAIGGQVSDVASTALALAQPNTAEANPFGLMLIPLKAGAVIWADKQPPFERIQIHRSLSAFGWGAAVSNICTAGVAASAGATAVPCLVLGIAAGWWDWKTTEGTPKEQFERLCAYSKRDQPELECFYTEPEQ